MKFSLRTLRLPLLIALLAAPLAAQIRPVIKPPFGPGGTYTGPGDTVPPPCTQPGCPTPTTPPPVICFDGPCTSDYQNFGCYGPCFGTPQPLPGVNNVAWTDINGNLVAPECMQGPGVYRVYHITIQDLLDAAAAAQPSGAHPRSNLCFFDTCPNGVDSVFIYTTLPFQAHPEGIPTSNGGYVQVCGMGYDFKLSYDDGTCIDVGGGANLLNSTFVPLECTQDLVNMTLQFDESCLVPILNMWGVLGVYIPWPSAGAWLNVNSVVFVVAVKCCAPNGDPTCY